MARNSRTNVRQDADEIFTDLSGVPDAEGSADPMDLGDIESDLQESAEKRRARAEADAELQVVDTDGTEGAEGDDVDTDAPAAEAGDEVSEEPQIGRVIFDPKDVQIIIAQAQSLDFQEQTAKRDQERAKSDVEAANKALAAALEAGNTEANVAATNALADAKVAFVNAGQQLQNIAGNKANVAARAKELLGRAPKDGAGNPIVDQVVHETVAPKAKGGSKLYPDFLKHNAWFNDPKHDSKRNILIGLDQDLSRDKKLDKNTPEYWAELGRRFNAVSPGLMKTPDGKMIATGQRQRRAGTGAPSGASSGPVGAAPPAESPNNIRLTSDDLKQMRVFGMDPSNMGARRQWLMSKREVAAQDARRAA